MGVQQPLKDISPGAVVLDWGDSPAENLVIRPTLGKIQVPVQHQQAPVHEEEFGDAPVSHVSKGTIVGPVEVPFTRYDLQVMHKIFPNSTEYSSGDRLIFHNDVGADYFLASRNMVIRPIIQNVLSEDRSEWFLLYHVHPYNDWTLGWDRDEQRIAMIMFMCYPKQSGDHIGDFYQIGV